MPKKTTRESSQDMWETQNSESFKTCDHRARRGDVRAGNARHGEAREILNAVAWPERQLAAAQILDESSGNSAGQGIRALPPGS